MSLTDCQKKLQFQASRRSTREMEELMHLFLQRHLTQLSQDDCEKILQLLDWPDVQLYDWITGLQSPPPQVDKELINWIRHP
ncbi:MAG: succinate dehydrogenase assembly factor 2 [Magnetococcales bacterium]|nr:succinate dehydrogenase assembly factor 2 [Magnetococcales bacterium]NGZ27791.1 succinate dehydrogenase assembly factor 2 [Magnetococcales bacterium]